MGLMREHNFIYLCKILKTIKGAYLTFGFMVNVEQNDYNNSNKNYNEYKSQTRFHGKVMAHSSTSMIVN